MDSSYNLVKNQIYTKNRIEVTPGLDMCYPDF